MELEKRCLEFRGTYEPGRLQDSPGIEKNVHLHECDACKHWCAQLEDVTTAASNLIQYDVPEQLTQSIMSSVEQESRFQLSGRYSVLGAIAAACLLATATVIPIDSFESLDGLMSTLLGLAAMALFHVLLNAAKLEETVA